MPHLISISLQNSTSINDTGLGALAKLKPLKSLNLKGCREVTDSGMAALSTLQQLTFLRIQVSHLQAILRHVSEADLYELFTCLLLLLKPA